MSAGNCITVTRVETAAKLRQFCSLVSLTRTCTASLDSLVARGLRFVNLEAEEGARGPF